MKRQTPPKDSVAEFLKTVDKTSIYEASVSFNQLSEHCSERGLDSKKVRAAVTIMAMNSNNTIPQSIALFWAIHDNSTSKRITA